MAKSGNIFFSVNFCFLFWTMSFYSTNLSTFPMATVLPEKKNTKNDGFFNVILFTMIMFGLVKQDYLTLNIVFLSFINLYLLN